jgi:hypothetical protein
MEPVTTPQIYAGSINFIVLQVIMIGVVVMFPNLVMHYKGVVIDPSTVTITVPTLQPLGAPDGQSGLPTLGAPQLGAPQLGAPQLGAPQLGAPAVNP